MAGTSTVVDNFLGAALANPPWSASYGGADVDVGRGRVPVSQTAGTPDFAGIQSAASYTLDVVSASVIPAPVNGATDYCITIMSVLSTTGGTTLACKIDTVAGTLRFESNVGFFDGAAVSITYSPSAHRWLKIQRTGGNIIWATSPKGPDDPGGPTWTTQRTLAEPAWTSGSSLSILLEAQRGSGSANYAYFNSFNLGEARHNSCPNPAQGANSTGWGGSASPARSTSLTGMSRTTGAEATASGYIQTPDGAVTAGRQVTVSFDIKNASASDIAGGKAVFVGFRTAGGDNFDNSFNTPALGVVGNAQRTAHTFTAPAGATAVFLIIDSLPVGIQVTAVKYEDGPADGTYFDGEPPGSWDGTQYNSTSTLSDVTSVSSDLDLRWRVKNVVASDADLRWRVRNIVASDLDARWRVKNRVLSDLEAQWRVRNLVVADTELQWRVRHAVTSDTELWWRVRNAVVADTSLQWRVRGRVASDLSLRWRVASDVVFPTTPFSADVEVSLDEHVNVHL